MPAGAEQRSRARQLKLRYHPDRAATDAERDMYTEVSKIINVSVAALDL